MDELKYRKKNLWMFPLGTVGRDMVYTLFTNYLMTFVLLTRSLNTAQLGAITVIMAAARVFDALNDPIMGNIIDRTRTRWGKFKPWLAIGILTTSIVISATFTTTLQDWSFVIFFGFIYLMFSITYTMHDISYWGMVPSLSSDADARNQFTSRATLFAGIGGTLASILIPTLTVGSGALGGSTPKAYGIIAIIISILAPAFLCFTIFGAHENRDYEKEPAPPVSLRKIVKTIAGNDQLLWVALIFLIHEVGNGIVAGGVGSFYIYFEFGYEGGRYSLFNTVGMMATAVLMVCYPMISRKLTRKALMKRVTIVSIIGYAIMILSGVALPANDLKFWLITIGYMFANFGQYCFYLVLMISILNTVEYNEYIHGTRDDAIISSLRPFMTKLGSAIYAVIITATYIVFHLTDSTNEIASYEQQASQNLISEAEKITAIDQVIANVQSSQTIGLLLTMTLLPLAFMLIALVLYNKKYKLDEEYYDQICTELKARKEQA